MNRRLRSWLAGAAVGALLLLRAAFPGVFSELRSWIVDRRGEETARTAFREYVGTDSFDHGSVWAVPVNRNGG